MKHLHLVVPDLILPKQLAEYACGGLSLPYLEKLLARAASAPLSSGSLEAWLCEQFGLPTFVAGGMKRCFFKTNMAGDGSA